MESIARWQLVVAVAAMILTAIGVSIAMSNPFQYFADRRVAKVRAILVRHRKLSRGELWAESGLSEKHLDQALEILEGNQEIQVYIEPATNRKMCELRYNVPSRGHR
jgi:hypothetical protein